MGILFESVFRSRFDSSTPTETMRLSLILMMLGIAMLAASVEGEQEKKWGLFRKVVNKVKDVVKKVKSFFEKILGKAKNCLKSCNYCPNSSKPLNICKDKCFKSKSQIWSSACKKCLKGATKQVKCFPCLAKCVFQRRPPLHPS